MYVFIEKYKLFQAAGAVVILGLLSACSTISTQQAAIPTQQAAAANESASGAGTKSVPVSTSREALGECPFGQVYEPIEPLPVSNYSVFEAADGKYQSVTKPWPTTGNAGDETMLDAEKIHGLLPNISSDVRVYDLGVKGAAGPFFSAAREEKQIVIDFMKYRVEPINDAEGKFLFYGRVGAGMRLTIDIETTDASLNLASLVGLAASAEAGKTKGEILTSVIGVTSSDITLSAPLSADLSAQSIQAILQAFSAIRSKFHENEVQLSPHIVARLACRSNPDQG